MTPKDKHNYFLKIAGRRRDRILEDLDLLGNCSNSATYLYDPKELEPIFSAIEDKLREVRVRMEARTPYQHIPFRLSGQLPGAIGQEEE